MPLKRCPGCGAGCGEPCLCDVWLCTCSVLGDYPDPFGLDPPANATDILKAGHITISGLPATLTYYTDRVGSNCTKKVEITGLDQLNGTYSISSACNLIIKNIALTTVVYDLRCPLAGGTGNTLSTCTINYTLILSMRFKTFAFGPNTEDAASCSSGSYALASIDFTFGEGGDNYCAEEETPETFTDNLYTALTGGVATFDSSYLPDCMLTIGCTSNILTESISLSYWYERGIDDSEPIDGWQYEITGLPSVLRLRYDSSDTVAEVTGLNQFNGEYTQSKPASGCEGEQYTEVVDIDYDLYEIPQSAPCSETDLSTSASSTATLFLPPKDDGTIIEVDIGDSAPFAIKLDGDGAEGWDMTYAWSCYIWADEVSLSDDCIDYPVNVCYMTGRPFIL